MSDNQAYMLDRRESEIAALRAEIAALKDALEELVSHQNGPPLPTWAEGWQAAMDKAERLLAPTAADTADAMRKRLDQWEGK